MASVMKYEQAAQLLVELEAKFPGAGQPGFSGNPAAAQRYNQLRTLQRDFARKLPKIMVDRLPLILQEKRYEEAASELTAFLHFFLQRVVTTEASARLGDDDLKAYQQMDFTQIQRLQNRLMEAANGSLTNPPPIAGAKSTDTAVHIAGGFTQMGNTAAKLGDGEFPVHLVYVDDFLMDRFEVSNAEYRKFLDHVQKTGESSMEHPDAPPMKDHTPEGWKSPDLAGDAQPVVGIDWFDAYAYAKWAGKRLPTEAEWERAARGASQRLYPWGDGPAEKRFVNSVTGRPFTADEIDLAKPAPPPPPPPKKGIFGGGNQPLPPPPSRTELAERTWGVKDSLPPEAQGVDIKREGKAAETPEGLLHMAGNAAEWVADFHDASYYSRSPWKNPKGPDVGTNHVFRGGSYLSPDPELTTFARGFAHENHPRWNDGCTPDGKPFIGLRCAMDLKSPAAPAPAAPAPAAPAKPAAPAAKP
jgi:formylglycine-generating enzyme required for sulfatase activity